MTHIAITLQSLLTIRGMTQIRLAELTDIDRPSISNYCTGKKQITPARLMQVARHVAVTESERVEIVIAYLKDELRGLSELGISEKDILVRRIQGDTADFLVVPLRLRPIFAALLQRASQPEASDLRDLLASLAHLVKPAVTDAEVPEIDAVDQEIQRAAAEKRAASQTSASSDKRAQTSPPSSRSEQVEKPA